MPVVSVTRLRVRSWRFLPAFFVAAMRSAFQARNAPGNLAVKILRDRRNAFWTATSWESEASMRAFMLAKPHGPAMRKLLHWCDEAALVHWDQADAQLPSWPEAHRRLIGEGRPSKVHHPSAEHLNHSVSGPGANTKTEVRLK